MLFRPGNEERFMLDAYKELTPVVYGGSAVKYLKFDLEANELCFPMHWHDRMEILRVVSGTLEVSLAGAQVTLRPGQVVIFTPRMMHCAIAGEEGVCYHTLMFDVEKFCNQTYASDKYLDPIYKYGMNFDYVSEQKELVEAIDRLAGLLTEGNGRNPLLAISVVYEIMGLLYQYCTADARPLQQPDERFRAVLEYVNTYYMEKISAKDISRKFGYNETYCCRRFKEVTGITMMKYIQILRLERAQKLLRGSDAEVGDVAWQCGFSDISYFSNCFKKHFGFRPLEFQKVCRQNERS